VSQYAARTDQTHAEVRDALRRLGYTVIDCARVGGGFPDLMLCGHDGATVLVEVKAKTGKLRASQEKFRDNWPGRYVVLRSQDEAIQWAQDERRAA
jgi:hypothetical protein